MYDNSEGGLASANSVLEPLQQLGIVTIIPWPGKELGARSKFINHCANQGNYAGKTKWLTWMSIDNFIVIKNNRLSIDMLQGLSMTIFPLIYSTV